MTATKVECQESYSESPRVEEIASYSYTVQEESSQKPQNGVLIEEFSETSEDNRTMLQVNRGVSIVSVSDDESTLKAISRDVSTDDMQYAELTEDVKVVNGSYEVFNGNGLEERILDEVKPFRGTLLTETIMEERSMEETPSEKSTLETVQEPRNGELKNGLSKETSKMERRASSEKIIEKTLEQPQTPTIEESKLRKQSLKIERTNSIAEKVVETNLEERRASVQNGLSRQSSKIERMDSSESLKATEKSLSRQSSRIERMDSSESLKATEKSLSRQSSLKAALSADEEVDEELEALLNRVKRQRSVLDDILEKESSRDSGTGGSLRQLREWIL